MAETFRVQQIDHVELYVPDRYEAARWFQQTLGLEIVKEVEEWASEGGPLMISSDAGGTKLALFEGEVRSTDKTSWYRRVAFRVDGAGFLQFLARLKSNPVSDGSGRLVNVRDVVDHEKAFSIYFNDPYGHPLEVTTYDHAIVRRELDQLAARSSKRIT